MLSVKKILKFSLYKSMGANEPSGVANLDPRSMVGRIYVGDHLTLLNISKLWASWFQRRRFCKFSHYKSVRANEPSGVANLDPRSMVGRIHVGDHLTLLHTKYLSSGPHGFREEDFLSFSHYKSMGATCCHGSQDSNPISPKIIYSLSPNLIMLHSKFG